jgi:hypothetical protein
MDAEDAVEAEAFAVLDVADVKAKAKVFQHVPEDEPLKDPGDAVIVIGDMVSEAIETKDGSDERGELVIFGMIVAEERKALRELKQLIKPKLHNHRADRGGWRLQFAYKDAEGFLEPTTGKVYIGNFRFTWFAFAAG